MAIYLQDGKILTVGTDIATSQDCCCDLEQWLRCSDDSAAAKLDFGQTTQDYAWLCLASTWDKCYNAYGAGGTATNPTSLELCSTTASTCSDLTGFPSDDNFNGTGCDTGSKLDQLFGIRWREDSSFGSGSVAYNANTLRVTANAGSNSWLVYNKVAENGGIDGEILLQVYISINQWGYTSAGHNTGAVLTIEIGANTYECIFRKTSAGVEAQAQLNGTNGTPVAIGVTTITFKFTRNASNVIEGFYNGTSLGVTKVDSGTITGIRITSYTSGGSGNSQISDFDNFICQDDSSGAGSTILIDPTGTSCT